MPARISAVVCTYNRPEYLRKALRGLRQQTLPPEEFEIIVVDNAGSDSTRDLVSSELGSRAGVSYLSEPRLGLSRARNTGLCASSAKFIAYLDDDAVPSPDWLSSLLEAFTKIDPAPACVGGRIEPIWEVPRPAWLHDDLLPVLTILDLSAEPVLLPPERCVWGTNMAFCRDLLVEIGGFPTQLGRKGRRLLGNEDTVVQARLRKAGHTCYYVPAARVQHHVHPDRVSRKWFRRRFFHQGVSVALEEFNTSRLSAEQRSRHAGILIGRMLRQARRVLPTLVPTRDPIRFTQQCLTLMQIGYIAAWIDSDPYTR